MVTLLRLADGHTWKRGDDVKKLAVAGLPVDRIHAGLRQRLLAVLVDPNIAYILLMLGFYGLLFELQNPGAILPGIVGGICLILAFLALSTLPVNAAGLALIVLGLVFFLAEIKVMSHGLLATGGVLSLLLGSVILFQGGGTRLPWVLILTVTGVTTGFFLFVIGAGLKAQRRPVTTGNAGMVGRRALAIERLAPDGVVRLGNELWRAQSSSDVPVGSEVEITGVDGLMLRVRPASREARS
jgi:membrane-bound serine protease (ClpP class)